MAALFRVNLPQIFIERIFVAADLMNRCQQQAGLTTIHIFKPHQQARIVRPRAAPQSRQNHCIELQPLGLVNRQQLQVFVGFHVGRSEQAGNIRGEFPLVPDIQPVEGLL